MPLTSIPLSSGETAGRDYCNNRPLLTSNAAIDSRTTVQVYVGHKPAPCMHYECYPWDYAEWTFKYHYS